MHSSQKIQIVQEIVQQDPNTISQSTSAILQTIPQEIILQPTTYTMPQEVMVVVQNFIKQDIESTMTQKPDAVVELVIQPYKDQYPDCKEFIEFIEVQMKQEQNARQQQEILQKALEEEQRIKAIEEAKDEKIREQEDIQKQLLKNAEISKTGIYLAENYKILTRLAQDSLDVAGVDVKINPDTVGKIASTIHASSSLAYLKFTGNYISLLALILCYFHYEYGRIY